MASVTLDRQVRSQGSAELGARAVIIAAVCLGLLLLWLLWRLTAKPVTVTVDGMTESLTTHRATVADLLLDLGIQPGENDRIEPALDRDVTRGMKLTIERARPVRILADGRDVTMGSWGATSRGAGRRRRCGRYQRPRAGGWAGDGERCGAAAAPGGDGRANVRSRICLGCTAERAAATTGDTGHTAHGP